MQAYRAVAEILQAGGQLYTDTPLMYPYLPPWAEVELAGLWLAQHTAIPFVFWMQVPIIVADSAIPYLIYLLAHDRHTPARTAASLYAFNPFPILLCAWHAQFDALPTLFALIAIYLQQHGRRLTYVILFAVLSIAFKPFTALLFPVILLYMSSWQQRLTASLVMSVSVTALVLPFLCRDSTAVGRELFGYSGFPGEGWGMLAYQAIGMWERHGLSWPVTSVLLPAGKLLFLAIYCAVLWIGYRHREAATKRDILLLATLVLALFYVIYPSISAQYFLWILPFLVVLAPTYALIYSAASTIGAISFYYAHIETFPSLDSALDLVPYWHNLGVLDGYKLWVASNLAWYLVIAAWLASTIKHITSGHRGTAKIFRVIPPRES